MTNLSPGPTLLPLSAIIVPALLGLAVSAGLFAGAAGYALSRASKESGESLLLLLERAQQHVRTLLARSRVRLRTRAGRTSWPAERGVLLRMGGALLGVEAFLVVGIANATNNLFGPSLTVFAVTLVVVTSLLANATLGLMWVAGPLPEGNLWRTVALTADQPAPAGTPLRRLLGAARSLALPPKSE